MPTSRSAFRPPPLSVEVVTRHRGDGIQRRVGDSMYSPQCQSLQAGHGLKQLNQSGIVERGILPPEEAKPASVGASEGEAS